MTSTASGSGHLVRDDIYYYTNQIVNVVLLGSPTSGDWVLVDAGMPKSGKEILAVCKERFGHKPPAAIILTHGHFDHVGGLITLLEAWPVPVYAHPLEFPYLTGAESYPEPDVTVEGGLLAKLSSLYPIEPIDVSEVLRPLPIDGTMPHMPGWRWIYTPGHSPGHVAFFRDADKVVLSGDAFITVRQDSLYKVLFQKREVNGPPRYLTTNWPEARNSVTRLAGLHPELVVAGHGQPMEGSELREGLQRLVDHFDSLAIPSHGKYVGGESQE